MKNLILVFVFLTIFSNGFFLSAVQEETPSANIIIKKGYIKDTNTSYWTFQKAGKVFCQAFDTKGNNDPKVFEIYDKNQHNIFHIEFNDMGISYIWYYDKQRRFIRQEYNKPYEGKYNGRINEILTYAKGTEIVIRRELDIDNDGLFDTISSYDKDGVICEVNITQMMVQKRNQFFIKMISLCYRKAITKMAWFKREYFM